jgi:hypothetical protein
MMPPVPRGFPAGVLALYEVSEDKTRTLLQELPASSKNRARLQQTRNDLLMVSPKRNLILVENNAN